MRQMRLAAIILAGLLLRALYTGAFYGPTLDLDSPSDYWEYRRAAIQILAGDWAFTDGVFVERPPLFPMMMAALGGSKPLILMFNQLLSLVIIPLTYVLARRFKLPERLALLAALLVALDPASIKYAGILMAEPLANLLLAFAFVCLIFARRSDDSRALVAACALAGAFIALSALARPSAYLLWIPLGLWIASARRRMRLLALVSLVAPALLGVGLWKAHNAGAFDNSNFSTIGSFNLLYNRAANLLRLANGADDIDAVRHGLTQQVAGVVGAAEEGLPETWSETRAYYRGISSEVEAAIAKVAMTVFTQHPLHYILTLPLGLFWILIPVTGTLYWPGMMWNLAMLILSALGLLDLARQRRYADVMFVLLPAAYFVSGTLLVCTTCMDTRARVMITPLMAVMAAFGAMRLLNRRRAASASPSPPAYS